MVFSPGSDVVKTAPHLCVCDRCLEDYGNCSLFASHRIQDFTLNEVQLRSAFNPQPSCDNDGERSDDDDDANDVMDVDYFAIDTICAEAVDKGSIEPFFFVKIVDESIMTL